MRKLFFATLLCMFFADSLQGADRFIDLGTGSLYTGLMAPTGFSLSAPRWSGDSIFNRTQSFTPNDPLYGDEWHLTTANVQGAWNLGYSGAGVTIGIVDDGVQAAHPDLNVSDTDSYDFVGGDSDPSPTLSDQRHGTAVAGVAAATGSNSIGVIGPAYNSTIAGLKVGFDGSGTYQQFIDATTYKSSSGVPAQNTIKIKNHSYGVPAPYIDNAGIRAEVTAVSQSTAAGTIHVLAAGNEGGDANWKRFQATDDAIVVSATADDGTLAYYSNIGGNVTVTAPSSGGTAGITTTDRTGADGYNTAADGDYTDSFGGTSSAAPLVAGIMALGAEANPNINTRIAKHLLAKTSTQVDASNEMWNQNAAGVNFNPYYGFGMIDAEAFVSAAATYTAATEQVSGTVSWDLGNGYTISDMEQVGASVSIDSGIFEYGMEEVILTVSMEAATGSSWTPTELFISVVDPYGNEQIASFYSSSAASINGLTNWNYVVNGFWGENPEGDWNVYLADAVSNDGQNGTLTGLSMTFNTGSVVPEPSSVVMMAVVTLCAAWLRRRYGYMA